MHLIGAGLYEKYFLDTMGLDRHRSSKSQAGSRLRVLGIRDLLGQLCLYLLGIAVSAAALLAEMYNRSSTHVTKAVKIRGVGHRSLPREVPRYRREFPELATLVHSFGGLSGKARRRARLPRSRVA